MIAETMKAVVRGGVLGYTLTFSADRPVPPPPEGAAQVLLEVRAAAINPVDYKLPRAAFGPVVGLDVSGVVKSVAAGRDGEGSDGGAFKVGDEVFGRASSGSLAEYATASASELAHKPASLSHEEAASIAVAYLTGLQSLRDAGRVKEGSSVLIIGASGGCGLAGVQLAKAMGAGRVVGICSGRNSDLVRGNGADEVVDYTDSASLAKFMEENEGRFNCVYDTATGSGGKEDYTKISMPLLSADGQYVQINGGLTTWVRGFLGKMPKRKSLVMTSPNSRSNLEEVAALLKKSGAKPLVNAKSFDEESVKEGFQLLKSRRTTGKIVFQISNGQQ